MSNEQNYLPIKRALISVSDKSGIVEFALALQAQGVEILSTGGTYKLLSENGVNATEVSDYTCSTVDFSVTSGLSMIP